MAARRSKRGSDGNGDDRGIRGAPLEPIRYVERELTRPDGTRLTVQVPVYPPFQLETRPEVRTPPPKAPARARASAAAKRKASDAS